MKVGLGLLTLLAVVSPSWSQAAGDAKEKSLVYYPLKAGHQWHYRVVGTPAKFSFRVAKIEITNGQSLAKVETIREGNVAATEHFSHTDKGLFRHRFNDAELSPPLQLLKYPIKKGESWESDIQMGTETMKVLCKVDTENVQVPAGKFDAVKVQVDTEVGGMEIHTTYWFAKDVGMVKQTFDIGGVKARVELEKFEKGK